MRRRVQENWEGFAAAVLPPNCDEVQYTEMRRAFFAGAFAIVGAIQQSMSEGDDVKPEDERVLIDLEMERHEYMAALRLGRA